MENFVLFACQNLGCHGNMKILFSVTFCRAKVSEVVTKGKKLRAERRFINLGMFTTKLKEEKLFGVFHLAKFVINQKTSRTEAHFIFLLFLFSSPRCLLYISVLPFSVRRESTEDGEDAGCENGHKQQQRRTCLLSHFSELT